MSPGAEDAAPDSWVLALRPAVPRPDGTSPAPAFVEDERTREGALESVLTVFLQGAECPWRCVMCDLWMGTSSTAVPGELLLAQIDGALARFAGTGTTHLKLYNAGSFFDARAVPPGIHAAIANRAASFRTLVVECHPALVGPRVLSFRDLLPAGTALEIAMGLETAHTEALARLNKRMTVEDFTAASRFLRAAGIFVRTFVLLNPPFIPGSDVEPWAIRSIEAAFDAGSDCVVVIPVRKGNGAMERLEEGGLHPPASLASLERVVGAGLAMRRGRVLADLWDATRLVISAEDRAGLDRLHRLARINAEQRV